MRVVLTLRPAGGEPVDVEVRAPESTPVEAVRAALAAAAGRSPTDLHAGRRKLPPSAPLGGPGLRTGDVVGVGVPASDRAPRPGGLELRVVGGPDSGGRHALPRGRRTVGRDDAADIVVGDPDLSRRHLAVEVGPRGVTVCDLGSTNGTALDGAPVGRSPMPWAAGAILRVGETALCLSPAAEPRVLRRELADGTIVVSRPPRLVRPPEREHVVVPAAPRRRRAGRLPVIGALVPLALGVGMAVLMHAPQYLAFAVLSPVMMVATTVSDRIGGRRSRRVELTTYRRSSAEARRRLADAVEAYQRRSRAAAPDPATIARIADGPGGRLWERRPGDPDTLLVRIGRCDRPADIAIEHPDDIAIEHPADVAIEPAGGGSGADLPAAGCAHDVPVCVPVATTGVLGVAGPQPPADALMRAVLTQLAVLHSPAELRLALVGTPESAQRWRWCRWLPHLGDPATPAAAFDPDGVRQLLGELARGLAPPATAGAGPEPGRRTPATIVVVDGAADIDAALLEPLLEAGPGSGVFVVCVDRSVHRLPARCRGIVAFEGEVGTRLRVDLPGAAPIGGVRVDGVSVAHAEEVARALAPLVDGAAAGRAATTPPATSRLLPLLGLSRPDGRRIRHRWEARPRSTQFVVGERAAGQLVFDLAKDGPHALVAGTTGAGKSELLQTIIAGLAVANRPDAMTFVLIDYKGGAAFKDCNTLPHTVGMVTDLDGHLTERALASLNAELKRREHLLGTVAAKDIEDYWDTTDGTAAAVLPRLVLVIDEFASLVEELPDFVTGLVGIAMRGRSLGVHLILATQRPSGVVSPVIRANTNLRIALRVTDAAESTDVIDAPDSAAIGKATPGRAFARVGAEAPVEFQAARVGGRALVPEATTDVRHLPWPPMVGVAEDGAVSETTDLQVLARAIREAASDVAPIRSPWLPPLPAAVVVSEPAEPGAGAVPYAIADRPSLQDRADVAFALPAGESLLVAGSAGSGRSSALRTIIGAAARLLPPTDLHVFVLDCAGGSLVTADELPHCAGYCGRADVARGARMLDRLSEEVVRRQALLARSGFASVTEQHAHVAADERLPWLLLLVDGWEGFVAEYDVIDSGRPVDVFGRLVREGVSAGVRAIVSGDRAALTARATSSIATRLVLRFADRADYGLVGLRGSSLPATMPPGRGVIVETTTEVQVALLDPDPGGPAQTAALRRIAATARETHAGADPCRLPRPVQPLPDRIALEAVPTAGSSGPLWTVIGVGGDDAGVVGVDLAVDGPGLLIAGPPRSGRSSALRTIAASLVGAGTAVVLVVARRSSLRSLHDRPGVLAVLGPDDADALADLAAFGPVVVLVDDVEAMTDAPVGGPLVDLLRADDGERAVVAAGRADDLGMTFRGILPAVRASRAGVLLQPRAADGDLLGVRLPRTAPDPLPGRGLLVVAGTVTPVQVAVGEPPAMQRPAGRIGTAALRRGA